MIWAVAAYGGSAMAAAAAVVAVLRGGSG